MTRATGAEPVVKEVRIDAPPETVFAFFIDPDKLTRWLCDETTVDPRPGGVYNQTHPGRDGKRYFIPGELVEVAPPSRLVFTWGSEDPGTDLSTIEVTFEPDGDGTLLRLVHRDLPESELEDAREGWQEHLDRLAATLAARRPGA